MSLIIITGSMMGGKTTKIIETKREIEKDEKNKILILNHVSDYRYSEEEFVISHNKQKEVCKKSSRLIDFVSESLKDFTHIFIDEAQFFHPSDLLLFVKKCLFDNKQNIIVSGLISNANLGNLGGISDLMRYADDIIFLKGKCNFCKKENSATATYVEGISERRRFYDDIDDIDVKKLDTYTFEPSCKKCWIEKVEKK